MAFIIEISYFILYQTLHCQKEEKVNLWIITTRIYSKWMQSKQTCNKSNFLTEKLF